MSHQDCEDQLSCLFEQAKEKYKETEIYQMAQINIQQANESFHQNFCPSDLECIQNAVEPVKSDLNLEKEFLYKQGYRDCMNLLRALDLL